MDSTASTFARMVRRAWQLFRGSAEFSRPHSGPGVLPAYAALARYRSSTTSLEPRLRLLVSQLAAERSHCRWCIERGRHVWRETQLSIDLLRSLHQYRQSKLFSAKERAALTFADAVTRYSQRSGGMPIEPLVSARRHFSEPEIAALTETVAEMHFFNPITGELGLDAAARNSWNLPLGSSIRALWL